MKEAQKETYYKDPINTVRSFMPTAFLPHTPIPIPPNLRKRLEEAFAGKDLPDDMLMLVAYVEQLRLVNALGYHIRLPEMLSNFLEYSQSHRSINFHDPEVQQAIRGG